MLTLALLALLAPSTPAVVLPRCDAQLQDIRDARLTLEGLKTSERWLRRRFARARTRLERRDLQRLLLPISSQARALEEELDRQERAYIRCVEAQLDSTAQPAIRRP